MYYILLQFNTKYCIVYKKYFPGLCANQNSVEPAVFYLLELDLASFTCLANFLFARTREPLCTRALVSF